MTGRIFYWNQTTFERAGIEVPKTFRELLYAGEAFKTKLGDEYYPLVVGNFFEDMGAYHGGYSWV